MRNVSTTVAVYADLVAAGGDWTAIETAAEAGAIDLADAALVTRDEDGSATLQRHSRHGWAGGVVADAVVGVLARLDRSLDRDDIEDLGAVMDPGAVALVVLTSEDTAATAAELLTRATKTLTRVSPTAEDVISCACSCP